MSSFSPRKKKHSEDLSTLAPASGLASSQVTQQLQFQVPTYSRSQSRSHLQSPQEKLQSQPVCPWSAHAPPFEQSPSPFLRDGHALSTSATAASELFLFGGYVHISESPSNDLYVISTRDFSTTPVQTSGDVPSPRYGHCAVLADTILLIWGGWTVFDDQNAQEQGHDDSLYLLNIVSREWTRIVVNGPGPGGRYHHTMTLVGYKLFVFGGMSQNGCLNDIWALDLTCLKSNPFWESYEPAPGDEKPLPRAGHVSVTTGDRIIIFGGHNFPYKFNDTWLFNIWTRKWTELQCTGSIPSPRAGHAAVLIDDVMYVFDGRTHDSTYLGDLTAFNLSTERWTVVKDIGPSPCGRSGHAMACDGRRIFVLGGKLYPGVHVDEAKLIHVLDTELLIYPKPDSNTVKQRKTTTQFAQKLSVGQPQHGELSSSDAGAAHGSFPFQMATSEDMGRPALPQVTREQNPSLTRNGLPSLPTGARGRPRRVSEEDDDSESSTEHHAKLVALDAPSGIEIAWLKHARGRLIELERQLSETLVAKTERDRRITQLTNELALKSALLELAEANAAEEKKRAGLEQRELQAKLGEFLLSRDQVLEQAQSALQKATFHAAEANEQSQRELAEVRAKLEASESELAAVRLRLTDADGWAKSKAEAETDTSRAGTQAAAGSGPVNMDVDRVMRRLMERMRAMEGDMASLRGNEKSIEWMECRNEG